MSNFNRYRIYCETEVEWVEAYADTEPTECPHNPAHTVTAESAAELDSKRIVLVPDADGQGIVGGETGYANELLRVLGSGRYEKSNSESEPVLYVGGSGSHPSGYTVLSLDQDNDGPVIDLDSEATSYPLINLQALSSNARGDICFGTQRAADPSSPNEADVWYEATEEEFKFRRNAATVYFRDAIKLQTYNVATTAPTDEYILSWNDSSQHWAPVSIGSLSGGPYSDIASSTTSTSTTSLTDVLIDSMSITPAAGKYAVDFCTTIIHTTNGAIAYLSIYLDGTQVAYSEEYIRSPRWVNAGYPGMAQAIVTVNGTQAIEARWRTDEGTVSSLNRSLRIVRVS